MVAQLCQVVCACPTSPGRFCVRHYILWMRLFIRWARPGAGGFFRTGCREFYHTRTTVGGDYEPLWTAKTGSHKWPVFDLAIPQQTGGDTSDQYDGYSRRTRLCFFRIPALDNQRFCCKMEGVQLGKDWKMTPPDKSLEPSAVGALQVHGCRSRLVAHSSRTLW